MLGELIGDFVGDSLSMSWVSRLRLPVFIATLSVLSAPIARAGEEDVYFETAQIIYQSALVGDKQARKVGFEAVREILDRIVKDFPASDLAVRIMLQDTIDGLDVKALDQALVSQTTGPE